MNAKLHAILVEWEKTAFWVGSLIFLGVLWFGRGMPDGGGVHSGQRMPSQPSLLNEQTAFAFQNETGAVELPDPHPFFYVMKHVDPPWRRNRNKNTGTQSPRTKGTEKTGTQTRPSDPWARTKPKPKPKPEPPKPKPKPVPPPKPPAEQTVIYLGTMTTLTGKTVGSVECDKAGGRRFVAVGDKVGFCTVRKISEQGITLIAPAGTKHTVPYGGKKKILSDERD